MELFFVQLLYIFRPILNVELVTWSALGFGFFELAAILLFALMAVGASLRLLHKNPVPVSSVEVWAALLIGWITISLLINLEYSSIAHYAQIILPPLTYILLKRILPDRATHIRLLFLMLIGFLLPFAISAGMTFRGDGLAMTIYWTGTERYRGAYANIHNMAHNAGFAMMLTVVYFSLRRTQGVSLKWAEALVLWIVFVLGAYLLFHTHVRTVYVGLAVFLLVVLFFHSKWLLALVLLISLAMLAYFWQAFSTIFFDVVEPLATGEDFERAGSGRIAMYTQAVATWWNAPFINQLTGIGIGNTTRATGAFGGIEDAVHPWRDPHNDWLYVLLSTGLIGLTLFLGLFVSIFKKIIKIQGHAKITLLGLLSAVIVMNLLSNSYVSRVALAQMFFMLIVYAELTPEATRMPVSRADGVASGPKAGTVPRPQT